MHFTEQALPPDSKPSLQVWNPGVLFPYAGKIHSKVYSNSTREGNKSRLKGWRGRMSL